MKKSQYVTVQDEVETPLSEINSSGTPTRPKYKISKAITVPTISFKNRDTLSFKCLDEIRQGKAVKDQEKPADLVRIINLETGELLDLILNTVLKETLADYGNYIEKCFLATAHQVSGKKYKNFTVSEIELEEGE